ncbi:hypothetical protein Dsin_008409 [Dipteronia sinensis]|uniref:Ribonuclease H1 N-terminal domain-containing protein n=1 Tax=Dipteronia sinensis TaxID=43782 RepID=A0AAE0APT3_9ROSI|nr:hypothetical protein Dsin_008409 [Dipteronia sinensis]
MAKTAVYAVFKGRKTGLFYYWPECHEPVDGFPDASFKKFSTVDEVFSTLAIKTALSGARRQYLHALHGWCLFHLQSIA